MLRKEVQYVVRKYKNDPVLFAKQILNTELDSWQEQVLKDILTHDRICIASGHGIGKTFLTSILILWFMCTRPRPAILLTANTKNQLDTKSWRALGIALNKSKVKEWFTLTATRLALKGYEQTSFASSTPWSEHNSEAFQGTHSEHQLIIMDEASAIPPIIHDTIEGSQTTAGAKWLCFGNPTRNTGRFREYFGKQKHRWLTRQIDSRTCKYTDKEQIARWLADYGEESDFFKVRVRGVFPSIGSMQFIDSGVVEQAMRRKAHVPWSTVKLLGIDIARFGDDQSVIAFRQGLQLLPLKKYRNMDLMSLSSELAHVIKEYKPDAVFVDGVGTGAGVVDRLRALGFNIVDVNGAASVSTEYKGTLLNKRIESWVRMREWLKTAELPDDNELRDDLIGPEYGFDNREKMVLEKKGDMKRRGLASPDCADALALTFAYPVAPKFQAEMSVEPAFEECY